MSTSPAHTQPEADSEARRGPRILIITGEASGDLHGANLAGSILALCPNARLLGVGGVKMRSAGVELLHGIERLDAVGMLNWTQLRTVARTYRALAHLLRTGRFDAVVFIDNPGLNLRLARVAWRAGQRVVYYIAPQIWAWHASRIKLIARVVDRMLVILPFELDLYRRVGVPCEYVGHPLLDVIAPSYDRDELRKRFGCDRAPHVLGLLPGSREREVRALLPDMLMAARRLQRQFPGLAVLIGQAASIPDRLVEQIVKDSGVDVRIVCDLPTEVMASADVLLVASGTATLQAAMVGTPMVITYKTTWVSYWLARLLVRVKWIGLVNLVAQRQIVPELIQQDATPDRLASEAARFLAHQTAAAAVRADLATVRRALGAPGASRRAAEAVLQEAAA
jgi:lipid-A-disaccharide synthase